MNEFYSTHNQAEEIVMADEVGMYNIDVPGARLKLAHARLLIASQPAVEADAQNPCDVCSDPAEGSCGDYCRHRGRYLRTT
ncbi:MAG: hypothetical protein JRI77_17305 [Deltaproteobacteria bacterium]|nr:hypothetical protein [Deltaproteobacteria bacterium]